LGGGCINEEVEKSVCGDGAVGDIVRKLAGITVSADYKI